MRTIHPHYSATQRTPAYLALLLTLMLALAGPVLAQDAPGATLLPNTPPEQSGSQPLTPTVDQGDLQALLAAYQADQQRDAGMPNQAAAWPQAIPDAGLDVYVPLVVHTSQEVVFPPVPPTPVPDRERADVAVALWAQPSIRVARGSTLTYEFRVRNMGRAEANTTTVQVSYDPAQIVPISSQLDSRAGDWVSALSKNDMTVTFGELGSGQERTGKVTFRVAGSLAINTVISMRGTVRASDAVATSSSVTNWVPVLVGTSSDNAAYAWLIVDPLSGAATTQRTFFSDRFIPGEGIVTWLNMPGATVRALDVRGQADKFGRVWLQYTPSDLKPGTYQLVAYGTDSKITGVISFIVR